MSRRLGPGTQLTMGAGSQGWRAFRKGTWRRSPVGLHAPRYTYLVVGRGPLGHQVHDRVRRSQDCLRARLIAPERAVARIFDERPDHALFCGPDRHAQLAAVRELVAALPSPPATWFGLAETTPYGDIVLTAPAGA